MYAYEYGAYQKIFNLPQFKQAFKIINAVSNKTQTPYVVVGGFATFLHTKNPPLDHVDVDIVILSLNIKKVAAFLRSLKEKGFKPKTKIETMRFVDFTGFRQILTFKSIIFELWNDKDILDRVTNNIIRKHDIAIEPVEALIVEKIYYADRKKIPDLLMAVDLINNAEFNHKKLIILAHKYGITDQELKSLIYYSRLYALKQISHQHLVAFLSNWRSI